MKSAETKDCMTKSAIATDAARKLVQYKSGLIGKIPPAAAKRTHSKGVEILPGAHKCT
jgi:hypothetical protein